METGVMVFLALILLVGVILLLVFYLLTLQNVLKHIAAKNRLVEPSNVWIMLIPVVSMIYGFILYPKICDSIKNEYESRGLRDNSDFGRGLGVAMPILAICGFIPVLGTLAGLANLIVWIMYWVKMNEYKNRLMVAPREETNYISAREDILD